MLDDRDIDAIADALAPRVAELLRADESPFPTRGLVDVDDVCGLLHVEREWVYDHKPELGAVRLGGGERGALRFDAAKVLAYVEACRLKPPVEQEQRRPPGRPRRRRDADFELLEIPDAIR